MEDARHSDNDDYEDSPAHTGDDDEGGIRGPPRTTRRRGHAQHSDYGGLAQPTLAMTTRRDTRSPADDTHCPCADGGERAVCECSWLCTNRSMSRFYLAIHSHQGPRSSDLA